MPGPSGSQAAPSSQAQLPGGPCVPRKELPGALAFLQDSFPDPILLLVSERWVSLSRALQTHWLPLPVPAPIAAGDEGRNSSIQEKVDCEGTGPQGGSALKTDQVSTCAHKSPLGMTRTGKDTRRDGGPARLGPQADRKLMPKSQETGKGRQPPSLSPGLRSTWPEHQGRRPGLPRALSTPDSDGASPAWHLPALIRYSVLRPLLEEMPHSGQATAFGPVVVDGDDVLLKGTRA